MTIFDSGLRSKSYLELAESPVPCWRVIEGVVAAVISFLI